MAAMGAMGAAADPRMNSISADAIGSYPNRVLKTLHDPHVQFEEYLHYAQISRAEETRGATTYQHQNSGLKGLSFLPFRKTPRGDDASAGAMTDEKGQPVAARRRSSVKEIVSDEEWLQASRAARTATWGAIFYLITTDILGPFTTPWAMSQLGWGPGAVLYIVFGALAGYSGWQLWRNFIHLDSDRYPVKNYGDLAFRIYGNWARYIVNVFQSLQFFFNVGIIILATGQGIYQVAAGAGDTGFCFIAALIIFAAAGLIVGQIRTLQRFGWLANLAVWLNLLTIFFTMGVVAHSTPNYSTIYASVGGDPTNPTTAIPGYFGPGGVTDPLPIATTGGTPAGLTFQNNVNGLMQAVFSYGGATLFCELMAEMRRPMDFWKGLLCADLLIFCCYIFFGMFVYGYQGQFTYQVAYQGINPYGWQTACNVIQLVSSLIAACLYGNIGIKVLYANVGRDLLHFPPLESKRGKFIWVVMVPIYWVAAFVVAASIPQFTNFAGLVGALFILQFTYTFPPILSIGFNCQADGRLPGDTFDPNTGIVTRVDHGMKRWIRGYMKKPLYNGFNTFYALGAFVTAVLGTYSAIYLMHLAYTTFPAQVAWSCTAPL